jgi:predicted dehydrogenase
MATSWSCPADRAKHFIYVHLPLIEDFNQAIRENREPRVSGEEGMKTSVLLEAAYHAAREGRVVKFVGAKMGH